MNHDLIHWLDDLRHELAATFCWHAVQTNLGAWPWQLFIAGVITAMIVPHVRHWLERELQKHTEAIKQHVSEEHAKMRAHISAEHIKLHARLTGKAFPPDETEGAT